MHSDALPFTRSIYSASPFYRFIFTFLFLHFPSTFAFLLIVSAQQPADESSPIFNRIRSSFSLSWFRNFFSSKCFPQTSSLRLINYRLPPFEYLTRSLDVIFSFVLAIALFIPFLSNIWFAGLRQAAKSNSSSSRDGLAQDCESPPAAPTSHVQCVRHVRPGTDPGIQGGNRLGKFWIARLAARNKIACLVERRKRSCLFSVSR